MTHSGPGQLELADVAAKRRWVLEQRLLRVSYREIAETIGVSINTVRDWVKEETTVYLPQEDRDELVAQTLAQIDNDERRAMEVVAILATVIKGEQAKYGRMTDVSAAATELRMWQGEIRLLRQQRAKLMGLDAPTRVNHNITVRTEFDEEIEELCSEMLGGGNLLSTPDMLLESEDDFER